MKVESQQVGAQ